MGRQTCCNEVTTTFLDLAEKVAYVDDLEALLQKVSRLVWKMMRNTLLGSRVGLIDVNTAHWAAELNRCCFAPTGVLRLATDGVVEDENTNSSGTTSHGLSANGLCHANVSMCVRILQQLFCLRVVLRFELVVIKEVLLLACVVLDLEAVTIESVLLLLSGDVVNDDILSNMGSLIGLWLAEIRRQD